MDTGKIVTIILILILLVVLLLIYGKSSDTNSNDSFERDDEDDAYTYNSDNKKTEQFYDDLAFIFPSLDKINDPIEILKYLFSTKTEVTEEALKEHCNGVTNFKNDNGVISFDTEETHFNFNTASSEVKIDDSVAISSSESGLLFSEEDKSLTMAFHKENDEYIVDDYSVNNPEGISLNIEQESKEEEVRDENTTTKIFETPSIELDEPKENLEDINTTKNTEVNEPVSLEDNNIKIDDEIIASDTSY